MTFGVYVHVPFCASRCDYCDFATWTDRAHLMDAYVDACVADLERRREEGHPPATSVFFGGGTPSILPADRLVRILDAVPRAAGAEVTVECNPDSVDREKLAAYRAAGVDRLSFGAQSMVPRVLAALGRTHDPDGAARAVRLARDVGFTRVNLDLIFGAEGESLDDWRRTLDGALALEPDHVSAYALTVEPATALGRQVAAGLTPAPDDDEQADKYLAADDALHAAGLAWYEISSWARAGGGRGRARGPPRRRAARDGSGRSRRADPPRAPPRQRRRRSAARPGRWGHRGRWHSVALALGSIECQRRSPRRPEVPEASRRARGHPSRREHP